MLNRKTNTAPSNIITMSINTIKKLERSTNTDGTMILRGYAVVFDDVYKYRDWWTDEEWEERIDPKAFDGVDMSNVLHLRDHDYSRVLGRAGKNTRIEVDEIGLFFETVLPNTELARETFVLAESEICDQCSFGFTLKEYKRDLGNRVETITKVDKLHEITVTPIPAYKSTVVSTMSEKRNEFMKQDTEKREQTKAAAEQAKAEELRLKLEVEEARTAEYNKKMKELLG